jgi:hypothetical protein
MTARGPVALEGVEVWRGISTGWRHVRTDRNGFYEIRGLIDGTDRLETWKDGFGKRSADVAITGNTRFDIELAEVSSP